jgi:uncharacterized protein YjbJ (UPF0337 family)
MDTKTVQSNWSDLKAQIKARWGKFNDIEVEGFKDNLDRVAAQVQKTYGVAKDQAEKELADFKASLKTAATKTQKKIHEASAPHSEAVRSQTGGYMAAEAEATVPAKKAV